jgi:glycosyltransferase involved in cell wall biosynthesis
MWLKRRYGLKWIADFRDPILGNPGRPRRWGRPYDKRVEHAIVRNADVVLTVTDQICQQYQQRYPQWADKVHLLWNGFDPDDVRPAAAGPARPYRTLSHVGVLYAPRRPHALLASLRRLIERNCLVPGCVQIRFIGPIQDPPTFLDDPDVRALCAVGAADIQPDLIPREAALGEIAASDYLLLLDIDDLFASGGYAVPAKLYDYAVTGRPILAITNRQSPVDRLLAASGLRYTCLYPADSAVEVDEKLLAFFNAPVTPAGPNAWFRDQFDGSRQLAAVGALLDRLTGRR